jgi:hypothetical protein
MLRVWGGGVYESEALYEWVIPLSSSMVLADGSVSAINRVYWCGRISCLAAAS